MVLVANIRYAKCRTAERQRDFMICAGITEPHQISKSEFLEIEDWSSPKEEKPDVPHLPHQQDSPDHVCEEVVLCEEVLEQEFQADLVDLTESPEKQSEIAPNTTRESLNEVVEEDRAGPTGEEPANHLLKTPLELTEGLLEAKRVELKTKETEIALLQTMVEKKKSEIKKKENDWKVQMKKEGSKI